MSYDTSYQLSHTKKAYFYWSDFSLLQNSFQKVFQFGLKEDGNKNWKVNIRGWSIMIRTEKLSLWKLMNQKGKN